MEKYVDIDIKQTSLVTHSRGYWESRVFTDYNFWLILNGEIDLKVEESVYRLIQGDIIFFFLVRNMSALFWRDLSSALIILFCIEMGKQEL